MKNFAKTAVVLLPKDDHYWSKDEMWIRAFDLSLKKMIKFINKNFEVKPDLLTTDSLAVYLSPDDCGWLNVSAPEDLYFARRNCEGLDKMPEGRDLPDEIYKKSRTKFPITRDMEKVKRFGVLVDREKLNLKEYVQNCKLVVTFENQNVAQYKVWKELKKDRIVLIVNSVNFTVKAFYNGEEIGISDLTGLAWTLNPVNTWEV